MKTEKLFTQLMRLPVVVTKGLWTGFTSLFGLRKEIGESIKREKAIRSIRVFFIMADSIEEYKGKLSRDTNQIVVDTLERSWIRDKLYNPSHTKPIAFCHDEYPKTLDLSVFSIPDEKLDEYMKDPDKLYMAVDRDFTMDAYNIGKTRFLESLRHTPRTKLILMLVVAHLFGWILAYYVIFYMLLH